MATGTVKSYEAGHGYGLITPDDGGPDVTLYYDSVIRTVAGAPGVDQHGQVLTVGQRVSYEAAVEEGRTVAEHVRLL
ncbi:cold shock domain-containing protein [Kitasatospora sp. NBC_00240]|uniref:cold-shock protein n=1 Tax=Kitasatospora sp. NBC_00240 TaxID=2903567 RepID=UPI002253FDF0|nr:cold shock domain-containing protein [Kitasatospora sp. NBC_00240]MCX5209519.1 cold shock domain-containing protein [Kitasatospora sp. NBC_00240]